MAYRTGLVVHGSFNDPIRKLVAMSRRVDDLTPIWPKIGLFLSREVSKQFTTHGAYMGTPWAPLKPDYRAWKIANGFPGKTLVMTGDMKSTFVRRPMQREIYHRDHAIFGSDDQKARWHAAGTERDGRQILPARPIMVIRTYQKNRVKKIMRNYIENGVTWPI